MSAIHREKAAGRWQEFSFVEQMANVGSEVERTIRWRRYFDCFLYAARGRS